MPYRPISIALASAAALLVAPTPSPGQETPPELHRPYHTHIAQTISRIQTSTEHPLSGTQRYYSAQAQEAPPDRERLTQFARAHIAINNARDEFHGKVARVHDEQGRERARQEMEVQVGEILSATAMTREEYDEIILIISLDGESRAMFDEILAELAEEGSAPTN
jgi:hypothetical protein